jgi:hypothetical protein
MAYSDSSAYCKWDRRDKMYRVSKKCRVSKMLNNWIGRLILGLNVFVAVCYTIILP